MGVVREMLPFQIVHNHLALSFTPSIFLTTPIRRLRRHLPRKGEGWS